MGHPYSDWVIAAPQLFAVVGRLGRNNSFQYSSDQRRSVNT